MYYLVNTTPFNGCLRVIPGSHLHDNPLHEVLDRPHTKELREAKNLDSPAFSTRFDEIDVPVRAGDLIIGDSRLLHASHANQSNKDRTVITLWYHPDAGALSEPVQTHFANGARRTIEEFKVWPDGEGNCWSRCYFIARAHQNRCLGAKNVRCEEHS